MTENAAPVGQRYSLVYSEKTAPGKDNPRARNRVYHLIEKLVGDLDRISSRYSSRSIILSDVSVLLKYELGVKIESLQQHFQRCGIVDFLDSVTFSYKFFVLHKSISDKAPMFLAEVRRIFSETNLAYRIDDECGIHPLVDVEFEANRIAAISNLSESRYTGALAAFEAAYKAFEANPVNGKESIRCIFESVEIIFKLIFPNVPRIGEVELRQNLEPHLQKRYSGDRAAINSAIRLSASLGDWVNAAHWYRHGQGAEDPVEPPLITTITLLSAGACFVRWLAELEAEIRLLS